MHELTTPYHDCAPHYSITGVSNVFCQRTT